MAERNASGERSIVKFSIALSSYLVFLFIRLGLLVTSRCEKVISGRSPMYRTESQREVTRKGGNFLKPTSGNMLGETRIHDLGFVLDLEIAQSGVPAKIQPRRLFSRAEDALKRRVT